MFDEKSEIPVANPDAGEREVVASKFHPNVGTKMPIEEPVVTANVILVHASSNSDEVRISLERDESSNEENSLTRKTAMMPNDKVKICPQTLDPFDQDIMPENENPELKKIRAEKEAAVRSLKTNLVLVSLLLVYSNSQAISFHKARPFYIWKQIFKF
jgi:hypothetical protein